MNKCLLPTRKDHNINAGEHQTWYCCFCFVFPEEEHLDMDELAEPPAQGSGIYILHALATINSI